MIEFFLDHWCRRNELYRENKNNKTSKDLEKENKIYILKIFYHLTIVYTLSFTLFLFDAFM